MKIAGPKSLLFWSHQGIFADMPSYGLAGALPSLASPPRTPEAKVDEIRGGSLSYVSAMPQCNEGSPSGDQKLMPTVSGKDEMNKEKVMGSCSLLAPFAVVAVCCRCCLLLPPSGSSRPDSGTRPSRPGKRYQSLPDG